MRLISVLALLTLMNIQSKGEEDTDIDSYCYNDIFFEEDFGASIEFEGLIKSEYFEDSVPGLFMNESMLDSLPDYSLGRFDILNPEEGPEGTVLVEGDMLMDQPEGFALKFQRKFAGLRGSIWPEDSETGLPTVPFVISEAAEGRRENILDAMEMWMNATCVRFTELEYPSQAYHVKFIKKRGCWSHVGYRLHEKGHQNVSLGGGCRKPGIIAHEIGHVLGLVHEQSRIDRDDHVHIVWENIKSHKLKNFKLRHSRNGGIPYDSSSLMHYGGYFFSKRGQATLITKNPYDQWLMGQRQGPTFRDAHIINLMYSCIDRWMEACGNESIYCHNGGYLGEDCTCQCPPGTVGEQCETYSGSYYPEIPCGGNVTSPLNITSPDYPDFFPPDTWCVWWAQAKQGQKVKLTFHYFNVFMRIGYLCFYDMLEIRTKDPWTPGKLYCGCNIKAGQIFYSENGGDLLIIFRGQSSSHKGFNATIDFVNDETYENEI